MELLEELLEFKDCRGNMGPTPTTPILLRLLRLFILLRLPIFGTIGTCICKGMGDKFAKRFGIDILILDNIEDVWVEGVNNCD
jgi:hypothetical protein